MPRHDIDKIGKKYTDQLGLGRNFFHNLKKDNPECFAYITAKTPGDIVVAYRSFIDEKREVTEKACEIYIELEDAYILHDFGRFLVNKGLYCVENTYFNTHRVIFKETGITTFQSFMRTKKSNDYYKEFKTLFNPQVQDNHFQDSPLSACDNHKKME